MQLQEEEEERECSGHAIPCELHSRCQKRQLLWWRNQKFSWKAKTWTKELYFKNEKYAKIEDYKPVYFSFFLLFVDSTKSFAYFILFLLLFMNLTWDTYASYLFILFNFYILFTVISTKS